MPNQKICLKWNSFHSNVLTSFESLWEEEGFVDVTLASDGQCIRAHKVILSACSPFFKRIFEANPCQHPVIILQDVHFSEVESLLNFVYKGEVHIDEDNLPALLRAAETLQIRGLSGASDQLKQKTSNLKKSSAQPLDESSTTDATPPVKRLRHILKSPPPPSPASAPSAATPTARPPCHRQQTTPPAENSQTQPFGLSFTTKEEYLENDPGSPDQPLDDPYESNDDSMDLMAKHMAMETEHLNEITIERQSSAFTAGVSYASFSEFEKAYNDWAESGHHPMSIMKSRQSGLASAAHPYHLVMYTCKHHGKPRKRGNNIRPKQHYNGQECPVIVAVKLMMRSKRYVVKRVISDHNHPVSAELRRKYPDRRIPKGKELDTIEQMIQTNTKVKAIRSFAEKKLGKFLLGRDIRNAKQRIKHKALKEASQEVFDLNEVTGNLTSQEVFDVNEVNLTSQEVFDVHEVNLTSEPEYVIEVQTL